jgi:hypothetical protein
MREVIFFLITPPRGAAVPLPLPEQTKAHLVAAARNRARGAEPLRSLCASAHEAPWASWGNPIPASRSPLPGLIRSGIMERAARPTPDRSADQGEVDRMPQRSCGNDRHPKGGDAMRLRSRAHARE